MKTVLIALGGNALIRHHELGKFEQQMKNIQSTCKQIAKLAKTNNIILTHGNGPQVGNLQIQMQKSKKIVPAMPLDVDVAMTQAQIGYLLQQSLKNFLPRKKVVTVVTQMLVDKKDKAFKNPSKPIGPIFSKTESMKLKRKGVKMFFDKGKGWRKIVPSPKPLKIIELKEIKELSRKGAIVIAAGGGGIPVARKDKALAGVEAVIDKDKASQLLANSLGIKELIILTDVESVYLNFKTKKQKALGKVKLKKLKEYLKKGEFAKGSMQPKIEATIDFIQKGGAKVIITSLNQLIPAMQGKTGTIIER